MCLLKATNLTACNGQVLLHSLTIHDKQHTAIVSDKAEALFSLLGGLTVPVEGILLLNGKDVLSMSHTDRAVFRRRNVGLVFQAHNLISSLPVYENLLLPLQLDHITPNDFYMDNLIKLCGLWGRETCYPKELTQKERYCAAIARAAVASPAIILAQAPAAGMEEKSVLHCISLLREVGMRFGITIVLLTTSQRFSVALGGDVIAANRLLENVS